MNTDKLYECYYTSTYDSSKGIHRYSYQKMNNEIELRSKTPFKRGDTIRVLWIDYANNMIEIEVVDRPTESTEIPTMIILSTIIPFDSVLTPVLLPCDSYHMIFSRITEIDRNKFYNAIIGVEKLPTTIPVSFMYNDTPMYEAVWSLRDVSAEDSKEIANVE